MKPHLFLFLSSCIIAELIIASVSADAPPAAVSAAAPDAGAQGKIARVLFGDKKCVMALAACLSVFRK